MARFENDEAIAHVCRPACELMKAGELTQFSWLPRLTWHSASFNSFAIISLKYLKNGRRHDPPTMLR